MYSDVRQLNMADNCTTDPINGCIDCPSIPATPGTPGHIQQAPDASWSAGANSIKELDGDVVVAWETVGMVGGIVLGFKSNRANQTLPELVDHGIFLRSQAGAAYVNVVERNVLKTPAIRRELDDRFEIRRIGGVVTYWHKTGGSNRCIYTSARHSAGVVLVNACMYYSGDTVK